VGCPGTLEDPARFFEDSGAGGDGGMASGEGGVGVEASPPPADGGCPDIPTGVFMTSCNGNGCHNATDMMQGLDLASPNVAARLVNVCATEGKGLLIDPTDPMASVIYTKLTGSPPFGLRMPFGQPALSPTTIACVLSWATALAADAGPSPMCGP
jgi:hypothetical protein